MMKHYPTTPDGRYFVVKGQLWRCSDPALGSDERSRLVQELMSARRAVKQALADDDQVALRAARQRVGAAKTGLGERGPVWWSDGAADYGQRRVENTPYAQWHRDIQ